MLQTLAAHLPWLRPNAGGHLPAFVPSSLEKASPTAGTRPSTLFWPTDRIAAAEALWGAGFLQPGGSAEVQRLVEPLALSASSNLLLLGGGTGGPLRTLAELGPFVSGYEADPELLAVAASRALPAKLAKRVTLQSFDPADPELPDGHFHHALALQPFRYGTVESILYACGAALKPYGHVVLLDIVADRIPDNDASPLRAWIKADGRSLDPPAAPSVTRALTRLGFDVHAMEDLSQNHERQAMLGWSKHVRQLEATGAATETADALVKEAECWVLRSHLMQSGQLKLMRWHAVKAARRPEPSI